MFVSSTLIIFWLSRNSSVSLASRYRIHGPRIESRWGGGANFPHPSKPTPGLTHIPIQRGPAIFPVCKAAREWCWPPTASSAEVKERVELYPFSHSGSSWQVIGWNVAFYHNCHDSWCYMVFTGCHVCPGYQCYFCSFSYANSSEVTRTADVSYLVVCFLLGNSPASEFCMEHSAPSW